MTLGTFMLFSNRHQHSSLNSFTLQNWNSIPIQQLFLIPTFPAFVSFEFANLTLICAQPLVTCCAYRSKYTVEADPAFTCMHTWPFKWCIFSFIPTGPGQELVKHPPSNQTLKLFGRGKKYRYESKIHSQI